MFKQLLKRLNKGLLVIVKKVVVYSAAWCPYCVALEKKLRSMNVSYEYKNVDEPAIREEMNKKTDNNQIIPVLFIEDKYWVNPGVDVLAEQFNVNERQEKKENV